MKRRLIARTEFQRTERADQAPAALYVDKPSSVPEHLNQSLSCPQSYTLTTRLKMMAVTKSPFLSLLPCVANIAMLIVTSTKVGATRNTAEQTP